MIILSNLYKSDNSESQNSLKLIFTGIGVLWSNLVGCISFLESNSSDIVVVLFEINVDDSIDSRNFFKDSVTHIQSLTVYIKEGFPFAWAYF